MTIQAPRPFFARKTLLAAALATATTPALAQLEEVIVTAQKREQTVQDVPSSVAAFSAEMLEKTNSRNFSDLGKIASGLTLTPSPDGFGAIIKIRGVGNNAFAPAIRPAVGIFLDDIPLASTEAAYNNMADIERVEVLKGPQSTLFGKEVSAGAISLFTKRPDPTATDAYIEGNFGNNGLQEFRLGGNLPLGDHFAVRASVYTNERDAVTKNLAYEYSGLPGDPTVTGKAPDSGELDSDGYRLRFLWEPTDNFSAILGYEDHDITAEGSTAVAQEYGDTFYDFENLLTDNGNPEDTQLIPVDPYDRKAYTTASTDRSTNTEIWSLHMDWAINDQWSITSVTSDQEYTLNTRGLDDSSFINEAGDYVPPSAMTTNGPYKIGNFIQDTGSDTFTQELRFNYEGDELSSIIGFFYADTDTFSYVDSLLTLGVFDLGSLGIPGLEGGIPIQVSNLSDLSDTTDEWAIFTHNIWTIREGLDLTIGLRYAENEKESTKGGLNGQGAFAQFLGDPRIPVDPWVDDIPTQKDSWEEVTGTIKVTYWLNDEMSIYGGWDRGFKAGGHNVCKGTDDEGNGICPDPFDSEIADNFELGVKGRFLDNTLVWNAAVFYQTYDDYQVDLQDKEGIGNTVVNAASVEISGFETDFQWLAGEHLLIDGNLAYVDGRWDDFEDAECIRPQYQRAACEENEEGLQKQDLSGKRLNYTSPWTANLNATWSDEFDNGISWYLRGEVAFRDDLYFFPDLDPGVTESSYTVLNASLGFKGASGNWDIIFWGKNLAEEEYLVSGSRGRDSNLLGTNPAPYEGWRATPGSERTYGMTLKYRIGDY
jgi:iron complex outermembrane recepter protein